MQKLMSPHGGMWLVSRIKYSQYSNIPMILKYLKICYNWIVEEEDMMEKEIKYDVKLKLPAGHALPKPPVSIVRTCWC